MSKLSSLPSEPISQTRELRAKEEAWPAQGQEVRTWPGQEWIQFSYLPVWCLISVKNLATKFPNRQFRTTAHWRTKTDRRPANGNSSACGQNFWHKARTSCIRLCKQPPWESKLVFERTRGWKDLSGLPGVLSTSPASPSAMSGHTKPTVGDLSRKDE